MNNSEFENIIKQKFEGASSEVPANAWAEVSSQIGTAGASSGVFSTLLSKIIGAAAAVAVVSATVIVLNSDEPVKEESTVRTETQTNSQVEKVDSSSESNHDPENTLIAESKKAVSSAKVSTSHQQESLDELSSVENESIGIISEEVLSEVEENVFEEVTESNHVDSSENPDRSIIEENIPQIEETKATLPKKIVSRVVNKENLQYSYGLDDTQNSELNVKWYVNDEYAGEGESIVYDFPESGEYTIIGQVLENGEIVKTLFHTETIEELAVIQVPNTFSPHSSYGVNNVFDIDHNRSKLIKWYEILVYDENQSLVFTSTEEQKSWDGYINGNPAAPKTYIYVINYITENRDTKTLKGYVVLQR